MSIDIYSWREQQVVHVSGLSAAERVRVYVTAGGRGVLLAPDGRVVLHDGGEPAAVAAAAAEQHGAAEAHTPH